MQLSIMHSDEVNMEIRVALHTSMDTCSVSLVARVSVIKKMIVFVGPTAIWLWPTCL